MIYLTQLTLNTRCQQVRRDLNAHYEMHRSLLRAFPDHDAGGVKRVLFRVEPSREDCSPMVLVQSEQEPDWTPLVEMRYARVDGPRSVDFAVERPASSEGTVLIRKDDRLRFRLLANPTVKRDGKRHGLLQESQQIEWIQRKAASGGFKCEPLDLDVMSVGRYQSCRRNGSSRSMVSHHAVRFEGVLRVTEPVTFIETIEVGIGSAKAFGFGLLSIARA